MESDLTTVQVYNVQPVPMQIVPATAPTLAEPYNVVATYETSTGQLFVTMTFTIPGNVAATSVSIKQYYNPEVSNNLQFYATYNSESTANMKRVDAKFKASAVDAAGSAITLSGVTTVTTMMVATPGPRTSRGSTTNVSVTGTLPPDLNTQTEN